MASLDPRPSQSEVNRAANQEALERSLDDFESRVDPDLTSPQEIYAGFSSTVMQAEEGQRVLANIRVVGSFDDYQKLHTYRYRQWVIREYPERAQSYIDAHRQAYESMVEGHALPVYLPASRFTGNTYIAMDSMEEAVELTTDTFTARSFMDAYGERVQKTDDIEEFSKRLKIATDPYCISKAIEKARSGGLPKYATDLIGQTHQFMKRNPAHAEAAFRLWEERVASLAEAGVMQFNPVRRDYVGTEFSGAPVIKAGDQEFRFQHPYFIEQFKNYALQTPEKVDGVITVLSMQKITDGPAAINLLDSLEETLVTDLPPGRAKWMQSGIDLLLNTLDYAQEYNPAAGKILNALRKRQKASEEGLSFSYMIRVANMFQEQLEAHRQRVIDAAGIVGMDEATEPIKPLDESSVADLPRAIDRIALPIQESMRAKKAPVEAQEIVERMSHVASLTSEIGAGRKLDESVITVGDLVMRYPGASAEGLRELIESMQTSKSEATVHQTYRELRTRRKNRAHFTKWAPGKGLLS